MKKRLIREASVGKIFNTLETVSRLILFKPYLELSATEYPNKNARGVASSAHTLVLPFFRRPQEPDIHTSTIGKVKECLNIIVIGLSHNTTIDYGDLLPFVYMSVSPFVSGGKPIEINKNEEEYDDSEIDENSHIKTSKTDKSQSANKKESNKSRINKSSIFQWNTSSLQTTKDSNMAHEKFIIKGKLRKVIDGANAPKITGKSL